MDDVTVLVIGGVGGSGESKPQTEARVVKRMVTGKFCGMPVLR